MQKSKRQRGETLAADVFSEARRNPVPSAGSERTGRRYTGEAESEATQALLFPSDETSEGTPAASEPSAAERVSTSTYTEDDTPVSNTGVHSTHFQSLADYVAGRR